MSRATLDPACCRFFSSTGLSPSSVTLPRGIRLKIDNALCSPQPHQTRFDGLASYPFARRYLGNRCFFLFLRVLRCFSSPSSPYIAMYSLCSDWALPSRVSPFGNLWIDGYLRLPKAFRSLSRPSSAPSAKASTLCSY